VDAATALVVAGGIPRSAPGKPLVVVVNDPDRATDTAPALRAIRDAAGKRIVHVVVATGSHSWSPAVRKAHEKPLRAAIGDPSRFSWHDGKDPAHKPVGEDRLDANVVDAKDLIAIGSVEPHWFAGLTGAHKTITVGVMHNEDIAANHVNAMQTGARPFRLDGNPVHEGFVETLKALSHGRRILALQHVTSRWFGGPPLECLAAAAPLAKARWHRKVARPFDFVVAVVEPPLSRTLYQAEKGIKNNEFAVRDGGAILLDAECEDGLGPDRFFQLLVKAPDLKSVRAQIETEGYRLGDHKSHRVRALQARGVRIGVVSAAFPKAAADAAGFRVFATRDAAAAWLSGEFGASARGAIVADAAHMVVET
jgi:nickel-dependent lactate racemase